MKPKLICIIGPTAVGKTELAIRLAEQLQTEILSCDSRQMFKEMRIGTAVPEPEQLSRVKHHFIQHISIHHHYTVYDYEVDALKKLDELFRVKNTVVLTGGSGLYLNALLWGMDDIPDPDPDIRRNLETRLQKEGLKPLLEELKMLDPKYYDEVDERNPNRVIRGLEVSLTSGKPFSSFRIRAEKNRTFDAHIVCLDRDREELFTRINKRVDDMVENGLLEEVRRLIPFKKLNALKTVGYRELFDYFDGIIELDTALALMKRNSRRYARRQLTWNRKYKNSLWLDAGQEDELITQIKDWVQPG